MTAFSGVFVPSETGTYTIRGAHDNSGMSYIDINHDGVFDAGERMGATYGNDGDASWALTEGEYYSFILMAHEHGGGQNVNWFITPPGGTEDRIDPSDPTGNGGEWATTNTDSLTLNITGIPTTGVLGELYDIEASPIVDDGAGTVYLDLVGTAAEFWTNGTGNQDWDDDGTTGDAGTNWASGLEPTATTAAVVQLRGSDGAIIDTTGNEAAMLIIGGDNNTERGDVTITASGSLEVMDYTRVISGSRLTI